MLNFYAHEYHEMISVVVYRSDAGDLAGFKGCRSIETYFSGEAERVVITERQESARVALHDASGPLWPRRPDWLSQPGFEPWCVADGSTGSTCMPRYDLGDASEWLQTSHKERMYHADALIPEV